MNSAPAVDGVGGEGPLVLDELVFGDLLERLAGADDDRLAVLVLEVDVAPRRQERCGLHPQTRSCHRGTLPDSQVDARSDPAVGDEIQFFAECHDGRVMRDPLVELPSGGAVSVTSPVPVGSIASSFGLL